MARFRHSGALSTLGLLAHGEPCQSQHCPHRGPGPRYPIEFVVCHDSLPYCTVLLQVSWGFFGWLAVPQTDPQCNPTLSPQRVSLLTELHAHAHTRSSAHRLSSEPSAAAVGDACSPCQGPEGGSGNPLPPAGVSTLLQHWIPFFRDPFLVYFHFLGLLHCVPGSKVKFTPCLPGAHPPAPS